MKIKVINIEKTQANHPRRALLTTLADTNNIPRRPSLSVSLVGKVTRQVRNSTLR